MTGNAGSMLLEPLFLLDESLAPNVTRALALVEYEIRAAADVFGKGVKDPEIIEWCSQNNAVWIHADNRARKEHRELILRSGIRTVWIRRKGGAMLAREQLRIISSALPRLIRRYGEQPRTRHYRASADSEISHPSLRPQRI